MYTRSAIVFNCYYNGLSIIRELGKNNIPVYAMDTFRNVGTYSKYAKYIKCPDPTINEGEFIDFLLDFGKRFLEKPIIFPTNDSWVLVISKNYKILSEYYILCSSGFETVDLLLKKRAFSNWFKNNGFSVPETWRFDEKEKISQAYYPLIVKPENRRPENGNLSLFSLLDKLRLTRINFKEELLLFEKKHEEIISHFLIQELIEGFSDTMYTVGIFSYEGNIKGVFTGRKVRGYPADIGDCVVGQIEKMPDTVIEEVEKICEKLNYTGIAEFEYKKDVGKNIFKLIEINPRSWSWIGITPFCGVNLPLIAYMNLTDSTNNSNEVVFSDKSDGSVRYVKIIDDLYNSCFRYKKDGFFKWHKSFYEWYISLKCNKLVVAEWEYGDVKPLFFTVFSKIRSIIKRLLK